MNGKVAMVAGGSSGLGLAAARELVMEGAHVVIGARDHGRLAAAERTLKEVARGRVATASVDITDRAAARRWVDETAEAFGELHIVIVSGAGPPTGTAAQFSPQDYQAAIDTALFPVISLSLAALPGGRVGPAPFRRLGDGERTHVHARAVRRDARRDRAVRPGPRR